MREPSSRGGAYLIKSRIYIISKLNFCYGSIALSWMIAKVIANEKYSTKNKVLGLF